MSNSFSEWISYKKWEKLMQKREKKYQAHRKFYQEKLLELAPFDVSEESFLISEDKPCVVNDLSAYQLPLGVAGYMLKQTYDENYPRHIISYQEALHLADIVALIRYDDPEINVSNAIRHYLGATNSYCLYDLGLSEQDIKQLNKTELIKYMQMSKTWNTSSEMIDAIRCERNRIAIDKNIQHKIGGDEYTTGYIIILKECKWQSVWVSDPMIRGKSLPGPLPVLLNVTSVYYSGEDINGPPSYEFRRHYGQITFPMLDFAGNRSYYFPFAY